MNSNPYSLEGKRVLITGASSGIGRACAIEASRLGAHCILVARRENALSETVSMMDGDDHVCLSTDLSSEGNIASLLTRYDFMANKISGLVHSAGIMDVVPLKGLDIKDLERTMFLNFISYVCLAKTFTKKKYSEDGCSFVAISSTASTLAWAGGTSYCASKSALNSVTRVLSLEYAKSRRIRFNTVSPAYVRTAMVDSTEECGVDVANIISNRQPLGLVESGDVAKSVCYLLSDASRFVTGTSLVIDGGATAGI